MQDFVQGWTEQIVYQLEADGAPVDLSGMSVALQLFPQYKTAPKALAGAVVITDAPTGKVGFTPSPSDLVAAESPLSVRWKVSDLSGQVAFFPRDLPEIWNIQLP